MTDSMRSNPQDGGMCSQSTVKLEGARHGAEGSVESLTRRGAAGWAWFPASPTESVEVEAVQDGNVVGRAIANQLRSDIASSGKGTGRYGFTLTFDKPLSKRSDLPLLRIVDRQPSLVMDDGAGMPAADKEEVLDARPAKAGPVSLKEGSDLLAARIEGNIDYLAHDVAIGWAWDPTAPERALQVEVSIDDRVLGLTIADQPRDDLVQWGRGTGRYGFQLKFEGPANSDKLPLVRVRDPSGLTALSVADRVAFDDRGCEPDKLQVDPDGDARLRTAAGVEHDEVEGYVDRLTRNTAIGWVWQPTAPNDALRVQAVLDDQVLGCATANALREDLAAYGKGTGRYGFELTFERPVLGEKLPLIQVHSSAGVVDLPGVTEIQPMTTIELPPTRSSSLYVEGHVDKLTRWQAVGWAWRPSDPEDQVEVEAVLDGKTIGRAVANELRLDLADWGKGTGRYGFTLKFEQPLTGSSAPLLRVLIATENTLPGNMNLPHLKEAEILARPRGAIETLLREHIEFTNNGPEFEDFDPNILGGQLDDASADRPWLIAFYLPQFHTIAENDRFWGSGFTEWRQLPRAMSRFPGHYQPRIPRDLGFYNLLDIESLRKQCDLAKMAGVHALAYYYYWFDGTRVLEKPLDMLLESDIHMPFMIIWANENWTRTWDGSESAVLLQQNYKRKDEIALLGDLARHFADPRYIRLNGRPLFIIYNPRNIPNTAKTIARWRNILLENFHVNPLIFMAQTFGERDPRLIGLDGAIEFPPHKISNNLPGRQTPDAYSPSFSGRVIDYEDLANASLDEDDSDFPLIKTVVPSWDNEPRRPNRGLTLEGVSPAKYQTWLRALIHRAIKTPIFGQPIVAINAWNEWAEGAYLEPDVHFGSAFLNATARAYRSALTERGNPTGTTHNSDRMRVSAILPNFNHSTYIVERIESVLCQTVRPDEIIFLDDCSTDDSLALARKALEAGSIPFQIIENDENSGGVFRQWIKGITAARHELVWIAETDDSAHKDFLLHILPSFQREDVSAAFGRITCIDESGTPVPDLDNYFDGLRDFAWKRSGVVAAHRAFSRDFSIKNVVPNASGLVLRKPKLAETEIRRLYEYRFAGDWYFYGLVLRGGSIAYCRSARSFFRVSSASTSRRSFFTERHLLEHRMVVSDLSHEYRIDDRTVFAHAEALTEYFTDRSVEEIRDFLTVQAGDRRQGHPIRICIASHSFGVGGGEVLPIELANELKHRGHHITYLVIERLLDGDVKNIRKRLRSDIPVVYWDDINMEFERFLSDFGIDVFNSHNVSVDYRLSLNDVRFAIPYVSSLHGGYETVTELLTNDLMSYLKRTVSSWLYLAKKNIEPLVRRDLPRSICKQSFNALPAFSGEWIDRDGFRKQHRIPLNAVVLVLCSRAIPEKGWQIAVKVAESAAKMAGRRVHLVLIGEGPAAEAIRALVPKPKSVTLLGHVDMPVRYLRCCDIGLFPSTFSGETFPLFLLECFIAGLPVVSTDVGEIPRMMGKTAARRPGATVAHNQSPGEIVREMSSIVTGIIRDKKKFARMRANASAASGRFSINELGNLYIKEFRQLLSPRREVGPIQADLESIYMEPSNALRVTGTDG